jgi:hypothetical protein
LGLFRRRKGDDAARLDARALQALERRGVDLARPLRVAHRMNLPDRGSAEAAAGTLRGEGWNVATDATAFGSGWVVRAERERVLTPASCAADRERFQALARAGAGDYNGWEALPVA